MEQSLFYEVCGWLASITMILGYLPQAIFLMMGVGGACFMLQGLFHKPDILWALFITNLVTTTCSLIVFAIKVYNDYIKKK